MRKYNRAISIILVLIICVLGINCFNTEVYSNETTTPTILGKDLEGKPGDEITVDVELKNNPGITSITASYEYDQNALELIEVVDGGLMEDSLYVKSPSFDTNPFMTIWTIGVSDCKKDGVLVSLVFKVKENAVSGEYPVKIQYQEDDIYNVEFENVKFDIINPNITIVSDKSVDAQNTQADPTETSKINTDETTVTAKETESTKDESATSATEVAQVVQNDGTVNVYSILEHAAKLKKLDKVESILADANDDSIVDACDVIQILRKEYEVTK